MTNILRRSRQHHLRGLSAADKTIDNHSWRRIANTEIFLRESTTQS